MGSQAELHATELTPCRPWTVVSAVVSIGDLLLETLDRSAVAILHILKREKKTFLGLKEVTWLKRESVW